MIQLPLEIQALIKQGKQVFLKEFDSTPRSMCENCAGIGYVFAFVAEAGPFRDPPALAYKTQVMTSVDDPMYGWVWYIGMSIGGACPVCKGMKRLPASLVPLKQFGTGAQMNQLAERFQK